MEIVEATDFIGFPFIDYNCYVKRNWTLAISNCVTRIMDEFFGKDVAVSLAESRMKYGTHISGYAVANNHEYIAESFTAWWYGETSILDPNLVKMFEKVLK